MLYLLSLKLTHSFGMIVKIERECSSENASNWLKMYCQDEPCTMFLLSNRKLNTRQFTSYYIELNGKLKQSKNNTVHI